MFKCTRQQLLETARQYLGVRFRHQGRDPRTGIDCTGLLVVVAEDLGFENLSDRTDYRRQPKSDEIRETLLLNCDPVPVAEMRDGDFFFMRLGGIKPRHVGIKDGDGIIHASEKGVRRQPLSDFPPAWFVEGFRLKGVID